ncbi:MAG: hypothetical protein HOQ29_06270, partial [Acidobacteria bacterium]|nr:hypothetical protein [Acidobacteriota bacterium]
MGRARFATGLLVIICVASGFTYQERRPWPPGLQQVTDDSPVLSPADEWKT